MKKDIFIGLDGGGTKTKLLVEDAEGNLLGSARAGPANIRLSVSQAWDSIFHALHSALKQAKIEIDDPTINLHAGMGLAGTEIPFACKEFLEKPHPFKSICLRSDAFIACLGAHNGQDGDIIIIGTGVIGYQIFENTESQVNGWGFPHADEGGGAWLGMQAIRKTLQWQDGRGDKSPMLEAIFDHFNNNLNEMVVWANEAKSTNFAELALIVTQFLEENDPISLELLQLAGKEINKIGMALEKFSHKPLPCSLFGGIANFIIPFLEDSLKSRIKERLNDAPKGAIFMIRKQVLEK
ncbi:MAG: hypothetical protein COT84_04810 [Chlamydiae bacterium CG10_big_fil_rev_8_21_14_0_10_35_9]|nr:MAG: hypothetical protein COT84_04810 [Chlamydiae bacterium CG10_big_fil_rev_8_21_14_0_10_35_9]